jgi:hypothetical protein
MTDEKNYALQQKMLTALYDLQAICKANNPDITDKFEIFGGAKEIMSLDYVLTYMERSFPLLQVASVRPYSFTIGSNNHAEGIQDHFEMKKCLFFGKLQICINPNGTAMVPEKIEIIYRSHLNDRPYFKTITRLVEIENYINESSESVELFDLITITQASSSYDFYCTFLGFKIDIV